MKLPYSGGCSCGEVRYECSAEPVGMLNCHCRQCQYASGGGFSAGFFVDRNAFNLLQGMANFYELVADSGSIIRRGFCSSCGSQLFAEGNGNPDIIVIKPASLDDPTWFQPQLDIFMDCAQPWDHLDPALPKLPGMPEA